MLIAQAGELRAVEDAVVEPQHQSMALAVERFEPHRRGSERPVDAGGAVVQRRAPHAVVDAHRRGDVGAGERRRGSGFAACRREWSCRSSGSSNSVPFGFRMSQHTAAIPNIAT